MRPLLISAILLVLSGCATSHVADSLAFRDGEQPRSILLLPAANLTTAARAGDQYLTSLTVPLSRAGYYIFPPWLTSQVLRSEGIIDGIQLDDVDPKRFYETFGADAVLKTTIHHWDTSYYVIGGNVTVDVSFELVSAHSGATLWQYRDRRSTDTTGRSSGNGSAGILESLLSTALQTAGQDYMPLARDLNQDVFRQLPRGAYHPSYQSLNETAPSPEI